MCYPANKARGGRRLYERLGRVPLGAHVLTIPGALRGTVDVERAELLRPCVAELLERWALERWRVRIGVVVCFHPTGDRCERCGWSRRSELDGEPLGVSGRCPRCSAPARWLPHFDVLVPLLGIRTDLERVREDGTRELAGTLKPLPYAITPADIADLRRRWTELLLELADACGTKIDTETRARLEETGVVTHYRFMLVERQKLHRFGYSARPFPAYAHIGDLRTYRGYGLASTHAAGAGVEEWKAAVRAPSPGRAMLCDCCPEPAELVAVDVVREWTWKWRHWKGTRLHSSCLPPPSSSSSPAP